MADIRKTFAQVASSIGHTKLILTSPKKMGEKYVIPEVSTNQEWLFLTGRSAYLSPDEETKVSNKIHPIKNHQIMLIDIFTGWSGPCLAVEGHLRRLRHSFVEAPDCLALARACCDDIEDLQPFLQDIRPTFLFWARGGPVALLRGANRPLLTKLIMQEVENEMRKGLRDKVDIDYTSERVIQCAGDLAQLEYDDVVRSIGCGNTDKLTTFGENDQTMKPPQKPSLVRDEEPQQPPIIEEGEEKALESSEMKEPEKSSEIELEGEIVGGAEGGGGEDEYDDYYDEDDIAERVTTETPKPNDNPDGEEIEENAFGRKVRRKKKKMETRLLKEILNDVKVSSKRFS